MPAPDTTSADDAGGGGGGQAALVGRVAELAMDYLADITDRPVSASTGIAALRAVLGRPLAEHGAPAGQVVEDLAALARTAGDEANISSSSGLPHRRPSVS